MILKLTKLDFLLLIQLVKLLMMQLATRLEMRFLLKLIMKEIMIGLKCSLILVKLIRSNTNMKTHNQKSPLGGTQKMAY